MELKIGQLKYAKCNGTNCNLINLLNELTY